MTEYEIRTLRQDDFAALTALESEIFGAAGESVLCPYYLRLVCDFYADSCFLALHRGEPVGYLLCFIKERQAYCTTLGIREDYQKKRVIIQLIRAFVTRIIDEVDVCWFTVDEDNGAARALHRMLGAVEVCVRTDFYGPGQARIVSRIDRARFDELRGKYQRLGLLDPPAQPAVDAA